MSSPRDADTGEQSEADQIAARIVDAGRLKHPRLHVAIVVVLGVLTAVSVVAAIVRLSLLPLLPLAPLGVAAYLAWRARAATGDRKVIAWTAALTVMAALAFWLLAVIGRILA
ncbi:hypothetical protein BAY61_08720 [Prauserella marina]|uniref:Uncharacterized protein n=1 Tax=Prauserella marina TaxID=530584 RepID=A0A222VM97_9PSEU|nr:hypothetical protein [Prauserella marina]ASR35048.1 hypothetical protein BAY61_08720 [Prauserella marina]PWV85212.1 hypothetical protein DES30_1011236 [Prauserella marina]SDC02256.1 hypothetical protein SAMN05421630_101102 [Prauserella marina]